MEERMQMLRQLFDQQEVERRARQLKNKQLKKAQKAAAQQAPGASAALLTGAAGEPAPLKDDEENQVRGASTVQDQHWTEGYQERFALAISTPFCYLWHLHTARVFLNNLALHALYMGSSSAARTKKGAHTGGRGHR